MVYFFRLIVSLSMVAVSVVTLAPNGWQLNEVGGFYRNAFAEKNFSFTINLSAGHIAANFF
jgi:hypothetical protein